MPKQLLIQMDPLAGLNPAKDTSLAFIRHIESQSSWRVHLTFPNNLWIDNGIPKAITHKVRGIDDNNTLPTLGEAKNTPLQDFDAIWIRQDPPFNMAYLTMLQVMSLAQQQGALVLNNPDAMATNNEKLSIYQYPEHCPPSLVTQQQSIIEVFLQQHGKSVIKPLDQMGGRGIFILDLQDTNRHSIMEACTKYGQRMVMVQQFLPAIKDGDCRILLIDGEAIPYTLVRSPSNTDFRGNMAAGGTTNVRPISEKEADICTQIGPTLAKQGLMFVGLDLIGDQITEINVTSPTGIVQIEANTNINICAKILESIEKILKK